MADIFCALCGEPYDAYEVQAPDGIFNESEEARQGRWKEKFLKGYGCPACDWGRKAPKLTKKEKADLWMLHWESFADSSDEDPLIYLEL